MPSRSFFQPPDFRHLDAILLDVHGETTVESLNKFRDRGIAPLLDRGSLVALVGVSSRLPLRHVVASGAILPHIRHTEEKRRKSDHFLLELT